MKYLISMRTMDRFPKKSYMHKTMGSLIKSGLFESIIPFELHLFDGGSTSIDYLRQYKSLDNLFIHKTNSKITRNENWLRSIEHIRYFNYDYVIQIEDDILVCDNWLESIDAYIKKHQKLIDKNPMTSFYAPYKEIERKTSKKIEYWEQSYQQFYGTQCILFKKDIALKVIEYIKNGIGDFDNCSFKFRGEKYGRGMIGACIDLWLQEWGAANYSDKYFLVSCPSFVQHIGEIENKHLHQSHFLGENWSYKGI
jgi:hypothetical protein